MADKIIERDIEIPLPIDPSVESESEINNKPYVLSDSFKRYKLPSNEDHKPPKRVRIIVLFLLVQSFYTNTSI